MEAEADLHALAKVLQDATGEQEALAIDDEEILNAAGKQLRH